MNSIPLRCLYVYLTDDCNLSCTHCWRAAPSIGTVPRSVLRLEACARFFHDALSLGLRSVIFSGGEPLLNPEFTDFVRMLSGLGVGCCVETNGMLLKGARLEAIKTCRVMCAISVDGATAETHNRQRGRPDAFGKTIEGLRHLEAAGLGYQVIMAISRSNYHELAPLLTWIGQEFPHCNTVKINIVMAEGRGSDMQAAGLLFNASELPGIVEQVATLRAGYRFRIMVHVDPAFVSLRNLKAGVTCGGRCGYHKALSILADGSVSICSLGQMFPDYVFGHVSTIDLEQVWREHPTLRTIRDGSYTRLTGVCSRCIFRRACLGGCRAHALAVYGDVFAPAPLCQAYYESGTFPQSRLRDAAQ